MCKNCAILLSLPAWECGLKYLQSIFYYEKDMSLPAWECGLKYSVRLVENWMYTGSLPAWECGLKQSETNHYCPDEIRVTPCVGVWIEIQNVYLNDNETFVTPCVGVWIEINDI